MKLLVLSDLHVEVAPFEPVDFDADAVVLAGDVHNGAAAIRWARDAFPRHPVVQVAGNHEFFDGEHGRILREMREAARACGVHFLENEAVEVGGVRFLGCTLWTDFRAFERPGRAHSMSAGEAMQAVGRLLADHRAISIADACADAGADAGGERGLAPGTGAPRRFAPSDAAALHAASRAWLAHELARPFPGPTVAVTHHLPTWRSVHPAFASSVVNAGFASDLDDLVGRAACWIHGHTHRSLRHRIGAAEVACNPRGYPTRAPHGTQAGAFENPGFDPSFCVEVSAR